MADVVGVPGSGPPGMSAARKEQSARWTFCALVLVQAFHSIEEYLGRLWESFPPARFVSGLVSHDLERGFLIANITLVAFGFWCLLWPVRREWAAAAPIMWGWAIVETINGIGHPLWAVLQRGYTPGVLTAPILLILAIALMVQLRAPAVTDRRRRFPMR